MEHANKLKVQIEVDRDLVAEAETAGLDLGERAEAALRRKLVRTAAATSGGHAERVEEWRREHAESIKFQNEVSEREGLFGDEWRTF